MCGKVSGQLNPGRKGKSTIQKKKLEEIFQKKYLEEIFNKNFPNLIKDIKLQMQDAQVITT